MFIDLVKLYIAFVIVVASVVCIGTLIQKSADCEKQGKLFVRTLTWYECVDK